MCGLVSPILRLFRVTESSLSCRVCRRVSRRAGLLPRETSAAETWCNGDIVIKRENERCDRALPMRLLNVINKLAIRWR